MRKRYLSLGIVLSALAVCVPGLRAQDGLRGALSPNRGYVRLASVFGGEVAAADFDRDERPDGAVLVDAGQRHGEKAFHIEFHLTARPNVTIDFSSTETGLAISTLDVNRDGAPDIVLEKVFTHKRLKVYLNDGYGKFQNAPPDAFPSPDESAAGLRARINLQDLPTLLMPVTRGFEVESVVPLPWNHDAVGVTFWPKVLTVQCSPRAPAQSRAPPALLSL